MPSRFSYLVSMLAIIACIGFNVLLGVIFRKFADYEVDNLQAITVNYFVAAGVASLFTGQAPWAAFHEGPKWLGAAALLGLLFILGFTVVAFTIQYFGMGLTAVFQKVSLVVTAVFAILYFNEAAGWLRILGIFLAVTAIYLINSKAGSFAPQKKLTWVLLSLPFLTFIFNGLIDTILFFLEKTQRVASGDYLFIATIFFCAGILGILIFASRLLFQKTSINRQSVFGGIVLGIPNFFSIQFFLLALGSGFDGSVIVPINNAGIILVSAIIGYLFFNEYFSKTNVIGIVLAIVAILLLSLPY